MNKWRKKGRIYTSKGNYAWNQSHAQVPVVDVVNDSIWRIYFATRDKKNQSNTTYIEVVAGDPQHVVYEHNRPILPLGKLGTFDESGVMPSWVVTKDNKKYLYYIGWTVRNTIPYHNSIGLAVSDDQGRSFYKFSEGPLFSPTVLEPYFCGTSCVLIEDGVWRNWYLSCTRWEVVDGKPEPFYHLKYAESEDGIHWDRKGIVAIDYKSLEEGGIVKASVIKEEKLYKMWYSYRNGRDYRQNKTNSYRIGYAESIDGKIWQRMDEQVGIDVSQKGWDSEMLAYPHVIEHENKKFLFYNGNGFGQSGFGYAVEDV